MSIVRIVVSEQVIFGLFCVLNKLGMLVLMCPGATSFAQSQPRLQHEPDGRDLHKYEAEDMSLTAMLGSLHLKPEDIASSWFTTAEVPCRLSLTMPHKPSLVSFTASEDPPGWPCYKLRNTIQ